MKQLHYYLAAFSAFFIWGFFSLALKPIADYPSLDILYYRIFLSVLVLSVITIVFRRKVLKQNWKKFLSLEPIIKKSIVFLSLGGSIILGANWFVFIYVVNHVSVKAGSLAYLICPIVTTVLAFLLLKESLSRTQWLAVGISTMSCLLLTMNDWKDILYSLLVAATYALYLVSQRKNHHLDKLIVLNIQLLFIALLIAPFYSQATGAVPQEGLFYICLFCIVIFFTVLPLFLNLYALKGLPSATVGILMYINPIINFAVAFFYFDERVSSIQLVSYALIIFSIVVFNKAYLSQRLKRATISQN